jgi:hypothetical protein
MKHLDLFENWTPEIATEWQVRKAKARGLDTLPKAYESYIKDDRYPGFRELMYLIWKNLTHEDSSKLQRLETLGLFSPADITVDQLMQLPGIDDIVKVFDNTKGGESSTDYTRRVNSIFPDLTYSTRGGYHTGIEWSTVKDVTVVDNGKTDITIGKGYIDGVEGPNGKIPIIILDSYYNEAWININDVG